MKFQKTSLASGKDLLFFSLPLILSGVLQQLYNWADAFIVGHVLGEAALASIGATSTLTNLLNLAITGFTLGLSIYAAKQCGGNRTDEVRQILSSFLLILSGIFALLSGFGAAFSSRILMLMDTPADMFVLSEEYLRVILWGVPFLAVYNTYAAILRAVGDTKTSFYAVLLSSILNVILDVILVGVLSCGVAGAAVATVISQIVMTVFIILYSIKKHPVLRFPHFREMAIPGNNQTGSKTGHSSDNSILRECRRKHCSAKLHEQLWLSHSCGCIYSIPYRLDYAFAHYQCGICHFYDGGTEHGRRRS
jgi:Na+-driven multidrug efflux pump